MDTTNHVERHWEWIKYTLSQGKVNRSLQDLIVAIIGSAANGTRAGGLPCWIPFNKFKS